MIYIIGAGGVGSWLTPSMCMLRSPDEVMVIDADKLEKKNLNRQLFTESDIGKSKAQAIAEKYGCQFKDEWFTYGKFEVNPWDVLMVCADNNLARRAAMEQADTYNCKVIVGANEVTSAEAYYYEPEQMAGGPHDPREYYPEINTDTSDNPMAAAIGCTGEAQRENRQLVTANFMAAALMQHLYVLWFIKREEDGMTWDAIEHFPNRIRQNLTRYETVKQATK